MKKKISLSMAILMTLSLFTSAPNVQAANDSIDSLVASVKTGSTAMPVVELGDNWSVDIGALIKKANGGGTGSINYRPVQVSAQISAPALVSGTSQENSLTLPAAALDKYSLSISNYNTFESVKVSSSIPYDRTLIDAKIKYTVTFNTTNGSIPIPGREDTIDIIVTVKAKSDSKAPNVSAQASAHDWINQDVGITINAVDNVVLESISYRINNNPAVVVEKNGTAATEQVNFTEEGQYTLTYWATDFAGNKSSVGTVEIKIDKTRPTVAAIVDGTKNTNDWYKAPVTVRFSAIDQGGSGLKQGSITGDQTLGSDGANQSITGYADDNAGNRGAVLVGNINIDKTPPTITGSIISGEKNSNGWYYTDVTVHFAASDALSGVLIAEWNETLTNNGANQSVSGRTEDKAGNTALTTVSGINIDKTAPVSIVKLAGTSAPTSPWYMSDVIVTLSATDNLSEVERKEYKVGDGEWQTYTEPFIVISTSTVSYRSVDNAGNTEAVKSQEIKIDKTAAVINHSLNLTGITVDSTTWYNKDVTVTFTASDEESGIASLTKPYTFGEGKNQGTTGYVVNGAGLSTDNIVSGINVDKSTPVTTISFGTATGSNGWFIDNNVQVTLAAVDTLSGINGVFYSINGGDITEYAKEFTISNEGIYEISYYSVDKLGNSETIKTAKVQLEKNGPVVTYKLVNSEGEVVSANDAGWFNQNVTVVFEATPTVSGGVTNPEEVLLSKEATGQTATGTATDNAGKTGSVTASNINIDKTAPKTTATADGTNETNAWYTSNVKVTLNAEDNLSGIAKTEYKVGNGDWTEYLAPFEMSETSTITYRSTDIAGNVEKENSQQIKIDKDVPTSTIDLSGIFASTSPWYKSNVKVALSASDVISEVAYTEYNINGGEWQRYTDEFEVEETSTVSYRSVDKAGNIEATKSQEIRIDKTAPIINHSPILNGITVDGTTWYNNDVTATFTALDAESGIASLTYPHTFGEGKDQTITGTAVNGAGLSSTDTVSGINVDKSTPVTTISFGTANGTNGWFINDDVQVTLTSSDSLSGVDKIYYSINEGAVTEYTGPITLKTEDIYDISYYSVDSVGNAEAPKVATVKLEKNGPVVTYKTVNTNGDVISANDAGWFNQNVKVMFEATPTISGGVINPEAALLSDEAAGQTATGIVTDNAGITGSITASNINIDKTAPKTAATPVGAEGTNSWYTSNVTVTLTAADSLSGTAKTEYSVDNGQWTEYKAPFTIGETSIISYRSTDVAGNVEAEVSQEIKIDKDAPVSRITPNGTSGNNDWYTSSVTFNLEATDSISGVARKEYKLDNGDWQTYNDEFIVDKQGATRVYYRSVDNAGNTEEARYVDIKVDTVDPVVIVEQNQQFILLSTVIVNWTATDAASGLETALGTISLDTSKVGQCYNTFTVTDKAGHTISKTISYQVIFDYSDVLQPINKEKGSIFKQGSTIPVKFQLKDSSGAFVSNVIAKLYFAKISNSVVGTEEVAISTSAATFGNLFRYDSTSNQYIFNLNTKTLEKGTYQLRIDLGDGTNNTVEIGLK